MHQSKISATGQTTVPAAIRKQMGATPGTILQWHMTEDRQLMVLVKDQDVRELRGMFEVPSGKRVTVEQMNPVWSQR